MVRDVPEFGSSVFRFLEENLMKCLLPTPTAAKASLKAVSSCESFNDMSECSSTCGSHYESAEEDAYASNLRIDAGSAIWSESSADFCAFPTMYECLEEEQLDEAVDKLPIEAFLTDRNVCNTLRMLPDLFNDGL
ncbi:hypothetical protein H632_c1516p0 [Helicosporidium sp. ATCC 50920]|nr:hypothetical protein H632_c1516p0 [Helicosporidium sp. ATCC 50920]|eukprot:KDD74166.1 hypothetical protein H632_c1516p0 [Helicosporidium sp. ATCC 50920]